MEVITSKEASHPEMADEEDFELLVDDAVTMQGDNVVLEAKPIMSTKSKNADTRKHKKGKGGFRKAPQAPRRFKSPYILFSISKMAEYKSSMSNKRVQVTTISRRIAQEWKLLPSTERTKWDQIAMQDKLRYNAEKHLYTGPWHVPSKRSRKDPSAPKRPASAFLFYCQTQRKKLKGEHPDMKNTEISKLLGQQWKSSPSEVRQPHIELEQRERELYKSKIAEWKTHKEKEEAFAKKQRQAVTEQYMRSGGYNDPPPTTNSGYPPPPSAMVPVWGTTAAMPPMGLPLPQPTRALQYNNMMTNANHSSCPPVSYAPAPSAPPTRPYPPAPPATIRLPAAAAPTTAMTQPLTAVSDEQVATLAPPPTLDKGFPPMSFAYSDTFFVDTTANDAHQHSWMPPYFLGDSNYFDPSFMPLLEPHSVAGGGDHME